MPSTSFCTSLKITDPLILYRSLLATNRINPDPAQHRLALHLRKIYQRLKDYEPNVEYKHHIERLGYAIGKPATHKVEDSLETKSVKFSFGASSRKSESLALVRKLTDHESALHLQSPQGLLLYGEVGTGKTMLVDLLAESLPTPLKRRWHFNTFILEAFSKLEHLRVTRSHQGNSDSITSGMSLEEDSLLWLAREMISTSPILFLDEFQLPDRAATRILSSLFTSFFHLGGVLIATSNQMPEELAKASGADFIAPTAGFGPFRGKKSFLTSKLLRARDDEIPKAREDSNAFLQVLRARCEVWNMEGDRDWRRHAASSQQTNTSHSSSFDHNVPQRAEVERLEAIGSNVQTFGNEQDLQRNISSNSQVASSTSSGPALPEKYFLRPILHLEKQHDESLWDQAVIEILRTESMTQPSTKSILWETTTLRVYGRSLLVPRRYYGITQWTFDELCYVNLGPADYITLASTFHTFILTDVPILNLAQKNEARRFITLLDALYEARCKLLIRATAGPDDTFFPELEQLSESAGAHVASDSDGVYSETFSDIYQDQTSPFRPNISSYSSSASSPSYDSYPLPTFSSLSKSTTRSARSILADEDSDFGPVYGAERSPPGRYSPWGGLRNGQSDPGNEIRPQRGPDFGRSETFIGDNERFAYKRARSRLWEMCGSKWWARDDKGWWRPVEKLSRRWEGDAKEPGNTNRDVRAIHQNEWVPPKKEIAKTEDTSPFRTSQDPPPKIWGWIHAWGMTRWGKKAGIWGKGPEGLDERNRRRGNE